MTASPAAFRAVALRAVLMAPTAAVAVTTGLRLPLYARYARDATGRVPATANAACPPGMCRRAAALAPLNAATSAIARRWPIRATRSGSIPRPAAAARAAAWPASNPAMPSRKAAADAPRTPAGRRAWA